MIHTPNDGVHVYFFCNKPKRTYMKYQNSAPAKPGWSRYEEQMFLRHIAVRDNASYMYDAVKLHSINTFSGPRIQIPKLRSLASPLLY